VADSILVSSKSFIMKKLTYTFLLSFCWLQSWSQSPKHEIYTTAGIGTVPFLVRSFNQYAFGVSGLFSYGYEEETPKDHVLPAFTLGYQYRLSKRFKIGVEIVYDKFQLYNKENSYRYASFMGRCSYKIGETKRVIIYTAISAGITNEHSLETEQGVKVEKNNMIPGLHFYILEVDYKLKNFIITTNTGLGMSGFINLGIKYRF
jgi:hypothetical protein